jgi:hypothetical protein
MTAIWTVRDSARRFARMPGLASALLLTIALGLGSNAAISAFIDGLSTTSEAAAVTAAVPEIPLLLALAAAAVFVVACANVAVFLLVRAVARTKDTCVRVALGADRRQLVKHVVADSLVIAVSGAAFGLLLAWWTANVIPALFYQTDADQLVFAAEQSGIIATAIACLALTVACGLAPIAEVRHDSPGRLLQREQLGASPGSRRVCHALVVVQLTCCSVLATSAGVLIEGFRATLDTAIGERLGDAVLATLEARPLSTRAASALSGLQHFGEAERRAREIAGIAAAGWVARPPGTRPTLQTLNVELPEGVLHEAFLDVAVYDRGSRSTIRLPPVAGRMFGGADTPGACPAVIVNEAAANAVFLGEAVGRSIEDPSGGHVEVIGVVETESSEGARRPTVYYYAAQGPPPFGRTGPARFRIPEKSNRTVAVLDANVVSASYFDASGLQVLEGDLFAIGRVDVPQTTHACRVAVVDRDAADRFFDGRAVGSAVIDSTGRRTTITGVVQSMRLRHWQRPSEPAIFFPMTQDFVPRMTLLLKADDISRRTLSDVHRRLSGIDGGTGEVRVTTLDAHLSRTALAPERIATVLVTASAAIALVLGVLGAFGVLADAARQRRREIAVRLALGAPRSHMLREVLGSSLRLGAAAAIGSLVCTPVVAPWLSQALETTAAHLLSWFIGPLAILVLVVVAGLVPMRRALSVDPVILLREE